MSMRSWYGSSAEKLVNAGVLTKFSKMKPKIRAHKIAKINVLNNACIGAYCVFPTLLKNKYSEYRKPAIRASEIPLMFKVEYCSVAMPLTRKTPIIPEAIIADFFLVIFSLLEATARIAVKKG